MPCNIQECLWQYSVLWDLTVWKNPFPFNDFHKPAFFDWLCYILFVSIIKHEKTGKIFFLTFFISMKALRYYVVTELQQRNCHVERYLKFLQYSKYVAYLC